MGIYYDGIVYGIGWELYNADYTKLVIEYEKRYEGKMTTEQIQEVKSDYDKLSDTEKFDCMYYVLTTCTTTYEELKMIVLEIKTKIFRKHIRNSYKG